MTKVIVYSTSACPWCVKAKKFLEENSIEFEEKNVQENEEAAREMIAKSGQQGVPVLDVEGEIIIGFDKERLKKLLKLE